MAPPPAAPIPAAVCEADDIHAPSIAESALTAWLVGNEGSERRDLLPELEAACGQTHQVGRAIEGDGDAAACTLLGVMLATGDGAKRDPAQAQHFFRRSAIAKGFDFGGCELGSSSVSRGISFRSSYCDRAAHDCPKGCKSACDAALGVLRSRYIEPLQRACTAQRGAACLLLGVQYSYGAYMEHLGYLVEGDPEQAKGPLQTACDAGVGAACELISYSVYDAVGDPNPAGDAKARALRQRACALGDGGSCTELAGELVEKAKNVAAGRELYERACELGMVVVCRELSELYAVGKELPRDPKRATRFGKLGAEPWF